jgi:hypothetical protein
MSEFCIHFSFLIKRWRLKREFAVHAIWLLQLSIIFTNTLDTDTCFNAIAIFIIFVPIQFFVTDTANISILYYFVSFVAVVLTVC